MNNKALLFIIRKLRIPDYNVLQPLFTFMFLMNTYRNIIVIFSCCILSAACHTNPIKGLTIDPGIRREVEKHITDHEELDVYKKSLAAYENSIYFDTFEDDSLTTNSIDTPQHVLFKSFYFWNKDTLTIDGGVGIWGTIGFGIDICNGSANLYHMLSSDDFPEYAYNENDSLIYRLQVPCTYKKIILSDIPDSNRSQVIYGYVEFKSSDYYVTNGKQNEEEILPRIKQRDNMKIYFKSTRLNLKP